MILKRAPHNSTRRKRKSRNPLRKLITVKLILVLGSMSREKKTSSIGQYRLKKLSLPMEKQRRKARTSWIDYYRVDSKTRSMSRIR